MWDRFLWGTFITPLNVLSIPYAVAVVIIIIYQKIVPGIPEFYYPSLCIWIFGLTLFIIPSTIWAKCTRKMFKGRYTAIIESRKDDSYKLLRNIAFVCIALSLFKIRNLSGNIASFGSEDFSEQYQSSSILNHISVFLSCVFSYAIYKLDSNHKSSIIIIVGTLVGMFAIGTKSWIIAPFLIGYYSRLLTGKERLGMKTTIFPILIIVAIFFFSYYLAIVVISEQDMSNEFFVFICNHFVDYFCGGVLTLSIDYKMGFIEPQMSTALFAPIINVFNALFGLEYVKTVNPVFLDIGVLGTNNVRTFFGTIIAYSRNPALFVILSIMFSTFVYYIYAVSKQSRSIFILLANASNLTFLTFGFFDFYWLTLSSYEIPFIFLIMHVWLYSRHRNLKT